MRVRARKTRVKRKRLSNKTQRRKKLVKIGVRRLRGKRVKRKPVKLSRRSKRPNKISRGTKVRRKRKKLRRSRSQAATPQITPSQTSSTPDGLVPGSRYNHIFAFNTDHMPEVLVDPAIWDRIVANLPADYKIPDSIYGELIYPGLF